MKKILTLALVMILFVCGCGKDEVLTNTCTLKEDGLEQTYKMTATNDEINKVELEIVYDNETLGVDSLEGLTNDQKEQIKTNMLTTLGLEQTTYEGFEIKIDIEEKMTVTIDADLTKADAEVLKKVGLDFSNTDMSLENAVEDFKDTGATCN